MLHSYEHPIIDVFRVCQQHDYRMEIVPVPKFKTGEMIMKVEATGVCASDLKAYHGENLFSTQCRWRVLKLTPLQVAQSFGVWTGMQQDLDG